MSGAAIKREFLGWEKPALPVAAARLDARYRQGNTLNMSGVLVVVPGQRAGRRLLELLAFHAEDEQLLLTPPKIVTQGALPELLYTPKLPFANDIVQDLAWAKALRELPEEQRRHVIARPPADAARWLELGKVLRRLHIEIAADGLDFDDVARRGPKIADFAESERWSALVALQRRYHELLHEQKLWDIQTARLKAIELGETHTESDIILLGTVDLNNTLRQMLDQVAERVTAFIFAPETIAERFDGHGCLRPEAWQEVSIALKDEQLQQVEGHLEQAQAVTDWLAKLHGQFARDEIVIGVADEALVPQLQRQLSQLGVKSRWVEGVRLAETLPFRLLASAAQFADGRSYEELAALVRHPDLADWLGRGTRTSLVTQLDKYYNDCLPSRVRKVVANEKAWPDLPQAVERLNRWLKGAGEAQSLREWGHVFRGLLDAIYGERTLDLNVPSDAILKETLEGLLTECDRLAGLPAALDSERLSAPHAFKVVFATLGEQYLPPPTDPEAVEILGWLELPLDDARALVVTSFNEGFVPQAAGSDPFLPDRLRRELNLMHNERRYARDAYAVSVLSAARRDLHIIFARRDTKKDPLQPSRLLFTCDEATLIRRAQTCFGKSKTPSATRHSLLALPGPIPAKAKFAIPRPELSGFKFERMPVTHFRTYIACPFRYYLRHVRRLKVVDDAAREMEGDVFGSLIHRVVGAFGRDPAGPRQSGNARDILDFLSERLRLETDRLDARRPALRLQFRQAQERLRAFATEQAGLVRDGWRIVYAEEDEGDLSVPFHVEGSPIQLCGRIDRIDFHDRDRTLRILDYKTADKSQTPHEVHRHRDKEDWVDLQLPMYRHLWRATRLKLPEPRVIQLAYFNLPKKTNETRISLATWDEATLQGADDRARQVISGIRAGNFKMAKETPKFMEDFAAICLDNVERTPELDEEGVFDDP